MTGSAMRKPRIQPGNGSAMADSMIDGRTIDTGTLPRASISARSPMALVNAYASGKPSDDGTGAARGDHAIGDPIGPQRFGLLGEQRRAGRAELVARLVAELGQPVGRSG